MNSPGRALGTRKFSGGHACQANWNSALSARTGENVSVIGLGGVALYKHSYELGVATVKHALDLGVSYFDTSPAYGRPGADGS